MTKWDGFSGSPMNVVQLLNLAEKIVRTLSPAISAEIQTLTMRLVSEIEDDAALLSERVYARVMDDPDNEPCSP
jgi:hypothetical protein